MNCFQKMLNKREKNYKSDGIKRKVLLIGISYIGTNSRLYGCFDDIFNTYKMLNKHYNSLEFCILAEDDGKTTKDKELIKFKDMIKSEPTKENILNSFEWLFKNEENDTKINLFFMYSGHGSFTYTDSQDELDHRTEMLCPLDYQKNGNIKDDDINDLLVKNLNDKKNIDLFGIIDACHSGSALDLKYSFGSKMILQNKGIITNSKNPNNWSDDFYTLIENKEENKNVNCVVLSGCRDSETSAEYYFNGKSSGVLTYYLWKIMSGYLARKQPITYKKLLKLLNYNIRFKNNFTQNPLISSYNEKTIENYVNIL